MKSSEESAPSPSNSYALSSAELRTTIDNAESGDIGAMHRLSEYYLINQRGNERGWFWVEKAAESGSLEAQQSIVGYYSSQDSVEMKARGELLKKKWGM